MTPSQAAEIRGITMYEAYFQDELPLNHEPCLNHWAKLRATQELKDGCYTDWYQAYETEWLYLDAEYNYSYEYRNDS